jgi:hypothetical protein
MDTAASVLRKKIMVTRPATAAQGARDLPNTGLQNAAEFLIFATQQLFLEVFSGNPPASPPAAPPHTHPDQSTNGFID